MRNPKVTLFAGLGGFVLFCSLCLFTVGPHETAVVEMFGRTVEPIHLFGDPPNWTVSEVARAEEWAAFGGPRVQVMDELTQEEYEAFKARFVSGGQPLFAAERNAVGTGLYLKWPAPFNRVRRVSKRLNVYREKLFELKTRSNEPIMVQPYAVWQVRNPLLFWRSLGGEEGAVDEKIESSLQAATARIIGSKYAMDQFYGLDRLKQQQLREMEANQVQIAVASEDVAEGVRRDVEMYRLGRRLGAVDPWADRWDRYLALCAARKVDPDGTAVPELALLARQALESALRATPAQAAQLKADYARQSLVPHDRVTRATGVNAEGLAALVAFAEQVAVEDLLGERLEELRSAAEGVVVQALRTRPEGATAPPDIGAGLRRSQVVDAAVKRLQQAAGRLDAAAKLVFAKPDIKAATAVAMRGVIGRFVGRLNAELIRSESDAGGAGARTAEEAAARRIEVSVLQMMAASAGAFADALSELVGAAKLTAEARDTEGLFAALTAAERRHLQFESLNRDFTDRNTGAVERASAADALRRAIDARQELETRLRTRLGTGLNAAQYDQLAARVRSLVKRLADVDREASAREKELQDVRGYPRNTVMELRRRIDSLQRQLTASSLEAGNTVMIARMEEDIREALNAELGRQYGIVVREVGFRRLGFPPSVASAVYERMKSERRKIAEEVRRQGEIDRGMIESEAERRKRTMIASAEAEALKLKGEGEAAAARIIGEVVRDQDAEFYRLWVTLNTLEDLLKKPTTVLVFRAGKDNIFGLMSAGGVPQFLGKEDLRKLGWDKPDAAPGGSGSSTAAPTTPATGTPGGSPPAQAQPPAGAPAPKPADPG